MRRLNSLSTARALQTFARIKIPALCQATDAKGQCVYIAGDKVGERIQVTKSDPAVASTMPAFGVIIEKSTSTECVVQWLGEMVDIYTGLSPGVVYVGPSGFLVQTAPAGFQQVMGTVTDNSVIVLSPEWTDSSESSGTGTGFDEDWILVEAQDPDIMGFIEHELIIEDGNVMIDR